MLEGKKALIVAAILAVGCGQPQDPTLHPEQELYEPLRAAVAEWQPHLETCGRSLIITADDADYTVKFGNPPDHSGELADTHDDLLGNGSIIVAPIALDPSKNPDGLVKALVHELGHVLGADDSDDSRDVMFSQPNGITHPSEHDVSIVCAH